MRHFVNKIFAPVMRYLSIIAQKRLEKKYTSDGKRNARRLKYVLAVCGDDFHVYGNPIIHEPEKIHIGYHVTINSEVQLCPRANIYIGDYVTMSRGAQIVAGELDMTKWSDEGYKKHVHTQADVYIGEGTWLCVNSTILPGVKITGKGVVVAAGAVVTKDVTEDYVIVGGVPAKIVKRLGKE